MQIFTRTQQSNNQVLIFNLTLCIIIDDYITLHKACDTNQTSRQHYMRRYHNLWLKLQRTVVIIDCFIPKQIYRIVLRTKYYIRLTHLFLPTIRCLSNLYIIFILLYSDNGKLFITFNAKYHFHTSDTYGS